MSLVAVNQAIFHFHYKTFWLQKGQLNNIQYVIVKGVSQQFKITIYAITASPLSFDYVLS